MRDRSLYCLLLIGGLASPAISQVPEIASASVTTERASTTDLQVRFAKLQQVARPNGEPFTLQIAKPGQSLLRQGNDGIVLLPEDWVTAAPDAETLDFLMLLGLFEAISLEPTREGPSTLTKIITGTIGFIGVNAARSKDRQPVAIKPPRFESAAPSRPLNTALRALSWAVASGGCEARVVAGVRMLEAGNGEIGAESRQIVKDLGAVAWTPNDRCRPPAH